MGVVFDYVLPICNNPARCRRQRWNIYCISICPLGSSLRLDIFYCSWMSLPTSKLSCSSPTPALRVQITQIDHCLIQPGSLDHSSLPRVPVIRIFGASSLGKSACLHIHQVYPYFFIEYTGKLNANYGLSHFTKPRSSWRLDL